MMYEPRPYDDFLEDVYAEIRNALGGEASQGGSGRRYGGATFYHDAVGVPGEPRTWTGEVCFTIDVRDGEVRTCDHVTVKWHERDPESLRSERAIVSATDAAQKVLSLYYSLAGRHANLAQ